MVDVVLGIGSNVAPLEHCTRVFKRLAEAFEICAISDFYRSSAVGMAAEDFINAAVWVRSDWSVSQITEWCKALEADFGRLRTPECLSKVPMDVDLMLYGDVTGVLDGVTLPRKETLDRAYLLKPLADIWPDLLYPGESKAVTTLWQERCKSFEPLSSMPHAFSEEVLGSSITLQRLEH